MLKTIDRLMQFISHAGLSARQFDISIGAANGYTLRMKKNRASIGSDVIENIVRTYPQLNVAWLITGEGEMLKPEKQKELKAFEELSVEKQKEIESIIENKIRERQEAELQSLLQEVTREIKRRQS
ncbi:hypothetical protein [Lentiprolixibacter aurantiacus]|uniref:HTH cro/C1-type domain-containing protein n=1 Tax=Lentiprolixibacter aurantiacus TaxID=2993939 RepID=A0AAE3SND9_9FLAO|nr:hypothetical protein [Lentiprolixibacter aurantiacus]MCX2719534.1 hypothetical protein [Lentiprolixibacter aurantiacus]